MWFWWEKDRDALTIKETKKNMEIGGWPWTYKASNGEILASFTTRIWEKCTTLLFGLEQLRRESD